MKESFCGACVAPFAMIGSSMVLSGVERGHYRKNKWIVAIISVAFTFIFLAYGIYKLTTCKECSLS
jgi:hypothetical protein